MKILKERILRQGGALFYRIINADGKVWLMPARNMQVAMNLYQPSGIRGRLLKHFFPYLYPIGLVRMFVKSERMYCTLQEELQTLLCQVFQTLDLEFSIFCGTPCVHQKVTIQLSKGKRILGYCKVTDNEKIGTIFENEQLLLEDLAEKRVNNVPQCLYCGKQNSGIIVFIQTTTKSKRSTTDHIWNKREELFLKELYNKTKQKKLFEQTELYLDLHFLHEHLAVLADFDAETVGNSIHCIMKYYQGKEVEFSFYHGDFTPWNIYVEKGELFVFDFEYAKRSYPPYLDFFHFITQVGIFEAQLDVNGIWDFYQREVKRMSFLIKNTNFAYSCYLLCVLAHYVKRENGTFNNAISQSINLWIELLKLLQNRDCQYNLNKAFI